MRVEVALPRRDVWFIPFSRSSDGRILEGKMGNVSSI